MTIDFDLYLLERPDFDSPLVKEFKLELDPNYPVPDTRAYRFNPIKKEPHVWVYENLNPTRVDDSFYSIDEVFDEREMECQVDSLKKKGLSVPDVFIEKLRKENGNLIADEELYRILGQHPYLSTIFAELEPVWGTVKHSHGAPVYVVSFEAKAHASKDLLERVCRFGRFLTSNYDGIMWSPDTTTFGFPDINEIHENYSDVVWAAGELTEQKGGVLHLIGEKRKKERGEEKKPETGKLIRFPCKNIDEDPKAS
jgi:hypothetical protein